MKAKYLIGLLLAVLILVVLSSYILAYLVVYPSQSVRAGWPQKLADWNMDETTTPLSRHQLVYEDVELYAEDGLRISAWYIPSVNSQKAIISFHGGNTDRRFFLDAVKEWHQAGFNVLMLDYRNHGLSGIDDAGLTFGQNESRDGIAAVDWLTKQKSIQSIGLIGASLGSATALLTADKSTQVIAIILQSTGYNFAQLYNNVMPSLPNYFAYNAARMMLWLTGVAAADAWNLRYPMTVAAARLTIPAMFIHGGQDTIVHADEAMELYEMMPGGKEFWLIQSMGHEPATDKEPLRYPQKVAQFFNEYL